MIIFYIILTEHLGREPPSVLEPKDLVDSGETASAQGPYGLVETVETRLVDGLSQLTDPHFSQGFLLQQEREGFAEVVVEFKSLEFPFIETLHYGRLTFVKNIL